VSLRLQLADEFERVIRQRGANYFQRGRVHIVSGSEWRVTATVSGTSRYAVDLRRENQTIRASCTCPYFDIGACKHIWAVVIAADTRGLLQGRGNNRGLELTIADTGENGLG